MQPLHPLTDRLNQQTLSDGVVAVEPAGRYFRVFTRSRTGVTFHDHPFSPFFVLSDPQFLEASPVSTRNQRLDGNETLCWLVELDSWQDWSALYHHLKQLNRPTDWFAFPDSAKQFLVMSGITFFTNLVPNELQVLYLALQQSKQPDAAIRSVALLDNAGNETLLSTETCTEVELLIQLSALIKQYDPDIITGYRLQRDDLPQIIRRARHHNLQLAWGRNNAEPQPSQGGHNQLRYSIYGRSTLDTHTLVRHYDRHHRPLPGTGLAETAAWFGCAASSADPALQSAREIKALYQRLAPAWYELLQQYPVTCQAIFNRPPAAAIQALMVSRYLRQRQTLPAPSGVQGIARHNENQLFRQGVVTRPIWHCDLSLLAAEIVRAYGIRPQTDTLGLFPELLTHQLCTQSAKGGYRHGFDFGWHELLSDPHYLFSDSKAAAEVARLQRLMARDLLDWLQKRGINPIIVDAQGIYLALPENDQEYTATAAGLDTMLQQLLPGSAPLRWTGPYQSLCAYRPDLYALLEPGGVLVFRGSNLMPRTTEPYLREFLKTALSLLLQGKAEEVRTQYTSTIRHLAASDCPATWSERLHKLFKRLEPFLPPEEPLLFG